MNTDSWVREIVAAFEDLGGAARYNDLYEYIERTTERSLSKEWKATVRRTIEDHSSDSANFRSDNLFRHVDHGFWALRSAGDVSDLVKRRAEEKPKAVIDHVLQKTVVVQEHWRRWPTKDAESSTITLGRAVATVVDGWITDRHIELKLKSGLTMQVPLGWYPELAKAARSDVRDVQVGEFGAFWPRLGIQLSLSEILLREGQP